MGARRANGLTLPPGLTLTTFLDGGHTSAIVYEGERAGSERVRLIGKERRLTFSFLLPALCPSVVSLLDCRP